MSHFYESCILPGGMIEFGSITSVAEIGMIGTK